ncbi:pyridoxamine 5'-phosphate oxidase family protein [Kitasatospora sp. NPDC051914]|uniref:pyridoxamine 5'-phosphate oxidase family protein n=1 Tax=Kitasatospora sp. NPDC051914 TaxID=3154945 RepID=UPI003419EC08
MEYEDPVEELSEAECRRLLGTVPVGRVVYTEHALPAVLPVAFEVAPDGRLVLALRADSRTARALDGTVAAFQADVLDPATRTGWSVLVHGHAEVVRDHRAQDGLYDAGLRPWAGGPRPVYVALTPELVGGRRLRPAVAPVGPDGTAAPR